MSVDQYHRNDVFGTVRDLPLNYVEREIVDDRLLDMLDRDKHTVIYGSSKQGKTCLRKHCIPEEDRIEVHCSNKWDLEQLMGAILKKAGYKIERSETKTITGRFKIIAKLKSGFLDAGSEAEVEKSKEKVREKLELDPSDVNDVIRALNNIDFDKYIILEDFHYMSEETQEDFSVALKAIHENSDLVFIIVGVWLEENRLISLNGDLRDRVNSVNADKWKNEKLIEVIESGERCLNVEFDSDFKQQLADNCHESVSIVQKSCQKVLEKENIEHTQNNKKTVAEDIDVVTIIREVVHKNSARYERFLRDFAEGFQDTQYDMYMWLLYPVIKSDPEELEQGIHYSDIRETIENKHPEGTDLNPGNLTQSITSVSSLQAKIGIKPFILDYDSNNRRLSSVDKGFLTWIATQNDEKLFDDAGLSKYL